MMNNFRYKTPEQFNDENILKMTARKLTGDKIIKDLYKIENEMARAVIKNQLAQRAEQVGVKEEFEKNYANYESYIKDNSTRMPKRSSISSEGKTNFSHPALIDNQLNCEEYIANDQGIYVNVGKYDKKVIEKPIFPIKIYENKEGSQQVTLAFMDINDKWKEITIPKKIIPSKQALASALCEKGVSVNANNSAIMSGYLDHLLSKNKDFYKIIPCADKLGWADETYKQFLPLTGGNVELGIRAKKAFGDSIQEKGSYEKWLKQVKKYRLKQQLDNRIEISFMLASSFASPLVSICGINPFWVHLWGKSGNGKTTCSMVAASIWANPDAGGKFYATLNATDTGLEIRADMLNNLPMFLEESGGLPDEKALNKLIYKLTNKEGRTRSNKELEVLDPKNWELLVITTSEQPLVDRTTSSGAENRMLTIHSEDEYMFECEEDESKDSIVNFLRENYGFAGKKFLEVISQMGAEKIKKKFRETAIELKNIAKGIEEKQINSFALIMLADRIATDYIFKDGIYIDYKKIGNVVKTKEETILEHKAYDSLCDKIAANPSKFCSDDYGEQWGRIENIKNKRIAYMYRYSLEKICKELNVHYTAFVEYLDSQGLIKRQNNMSKGKVIVVTINGKSERVVGIFLPDLSEIRENAVDFIDQTENVFD